MATTDTTALALTIAPAAGPAGTTFTITGTGLPPNATLHAVGRGQDLSIIMSLPATVGADGILTLLYNSLGQAPGSYTVAVGSDVTAAMVVTGGRIFARGAFAITEGGLAPTLTLEPDRGPCTAPDPHVLARGQNFPPGASIGLYLFQPDGSQSSLDYVTKGVVNADGTFAWPVRLTGCDSTTLDGTHFRINAVRRQGNIDPRQGLASATFMVSASSSPLPVLPTHPPERLMEEWSAMMLNVRKVYHGQAKLGQTLMLFQDGGTKDGSTIARFPDTDPRYQPGERYVLLLEPAGPDLFRLIAPEGRYQIGPGDIVVPRITDNAVVRDLRGKPLAYLEQLLNMP